MGWRGAARAGAQCRGRRTGDGRLEPQSSAGAAQGCKVRPLRRQRSLDGGRLHGRAQLQDEAPCGCRCCCCCAGRGRWCQYHKVSQCAPADGCTREQFGAVVADEEAECAAVVEAAPGAPRLDGAPHAVRPSCCAGPCEQQGGQRRGQVGEVGRRRKLLRREAGYLGREGLGRGREERSGTVQSISREPAPPLLTCG